MLNGCCFSTCKVPPLKEIKKMKDPPNQLMWGEPIHVFGALELFGSMLAYRWTPKCRKGLLKLIIRQQDSNVDQSTTNQKKQSLILFYIATIDRYFFKKKKKNHYRQASSLQLVDSGKKKTENQILIMVNPTDLDLQSNKTSLLIKLSKIEHNIIQQLSKSDTYRSIKL